MLALAGRTGTRVAAASQLLHMVTRHESQQYLRALPHGGHGYNCRLAIRRLPLLHTVGRLPRRSSSSVSGHPGQVLVGLVELEAAVPGQLRPQRADAVA